MGYFQTQPKENTELIRQIEAWFSTMKSVMTTSTMAAATHNPPLTVTSQRTTFCVMCSALGSPCPLFSPPALTVSPPHSNWSDMKEEEVWDGEKQKEKEH